MLYRRYGPGRSGTSVVAAMLNCFGVDMGGCLIPPSPANPVGHFEDKNVVTYNEKIILGDGDGVSQMETYIQSRYDNPRFIHRLGWGMKDPRFCHTWELVRPFLRRYTVIVCERETVDSIESCVRAYGWSHQRATELISWRQERLNRIVEQESALVVDFAEMMSHPQKVARDLWLWLGDHAGNSSLPTLKEAAKLVNPSLSQARQGNAKDLR